MAITGLPPAIPLMNASPWRINCLIGQAALAPQIEQELQQGQTQDREMVAVDALEQLNAGALDLIAPDARRQRRSDRLDVGFQKAVREFPHGQPGDLAML